MGDASAYMSNEVPNLVYCINSTTDAAERDTDPIVSALCHLNSIKATPFRRSSSTQGGVSGATLRVLHACQKIDFKRGKIAKDAVLLTCHLTSLLQFLRTTVTQFSFKGMCGKLYYGLKGAYSLL